VNPWQVKSLRADANLVVRAYELPRVHCLIPNVRKPLTASRTFRRALAYGINWPGDFAAASSRRRAARLRGPPRSVSRQRLAKDAVGYASDAEIAPWPYDPRLR